MDVHPSARKHGVADEDIKHALRNAVSIDRQSADRVLYLGPARDGGLLEVVTVLRVGTRDIAIHAMPMRAKYQHLLPTSPES